MDFTATKGTKMALATEVYKAKAQKAEALKERASTYTDIQIISMQKTTNNVQKLLDAVLMEVFNNAPDNQVADLPGKDYYFIHRDGACRKTKSIAKVTCGGKTFYMLEASAEHNFEKHFEEERYLMRKNSNEKYKHRK